MSYDAPGAIAVLRDGLKLGREVSFKQADTLLVFELAWTLLAERRYEEAAIEFVRMTELNNWSPATYYFIACGEILCILSSCSDDLPCRMLHHHRQAGQGPGAVRRSSWND